MGRKICKITEENIMNNVVTEAVDATKVKKLDLGAKRAYAKEDIDWFESRSDEELAILWHLCHITKTNSFGRVYDDEVYDAIYDRPTSVQIFERANKLTDEEGETYSPLKYDDKAKETWGDLFDISNPQEVADDLNRAVVLNGVVYYPKKHVEEKLCETVDGIGETQLLIDNNEYLYNSVQDKLKHIWSQYQLPAEERKGAYKYSAFEDSATSAVRKIIFSVARDYRLTTNATERNNLAKEYVSEFINYNKSNTIKEAKVEEIKSVKVYNPYNYTIQELRIDNDAKTFERGNFTMGKADKRFKNKQEYEDFVDELVKKGYKEIPSDYKSLRNKTRKGIPQ